VFLGLGEWLRVTAALIRLCAHIDCNGQRAAATRHGNVRMFALLLWVVYKCEGDTLVTVSFTISPVTHTNNLSLRKWVFSCISICCCSI
jgi:hypothetical protein